MTTASGYCAATALAFTPDEAQRPVSRHLARQVLFTRRRPDDLERNAQPLQQCPPVG